jgi:hypothetical protein
MWPTPGIPSLGLRPVPEVHAEQIKCADLLDMMEMEERRGKRHPDLDDPYNQVRGVKFSAKVACLPGAHLLQN